MDRDEALGLLRGEGNGIREWNGRRATGEMIPDLGGADLSGVDLRESASSEDGVNLQGVQLAGAKFVGACLSHSALSGANLLKADLSGARFYMATLFGTDLSGAILRGADLNKAWLRGVKFAGADLRGADFREALLDGPDFRRALLAGALFFRSQLAGGAFTDNDLSEVEGLDQIEHLGPSSIGTDTLIRSRGRIPGEFLRSCGLPDAWVEYLPDLIGSMKPIQFYSCFISHSSKNKDFVKRLESRMRQEKLSVWAAPRDMRGGRKSIDQIDRAIYSYDKLLLVLSKTSMESHWVQHEVSRAVKRGRVENRSTLFPIGLVSIKAIQAWTAFDSDLGLDLAKVVREYHIPDFSKWRNDDAFEAAFAELLHDLEAEDVAGA